MRILSRTGDMKGYHGIIGTPTNMYDYYGKQLSVGDVVCIITVDAAGKEISNHGIDFVCEEDTSIVNYTGKNHQYVMGISSVYNNENFKVLEGIEMNTDEWNEKFDNIGSDFRVYKVKDHSRLVAGEKIDFLSVVDVNAHTL